MTIAAVCVLHSVTVQKLPQHFHTVACHPKGDITKWTVLHECKRHTVMTYLTWSNVQWNTRCLFWVWLVHTILPDTLDGIINNLIVLIFHISHECKQWWWQKVVTYFALAFLIFFKSI